MLCCIVTFLVCDWHATVSIIIISTYLKLSYKMKICGLGFILAAWQIYRICLLKMLPINFYCLTLVHELPIGTYMWSTNGTIEFKATCCNWRDTMALQRVVPIAYYSYSYITTEIHAESPDPVCYRHNSHVARPLFFCCTNAQK